MSMPLAYCPQGKASIESTPRCRVFPAAKDHCTVISSFSELGMSGRRKKAWKPVVPAEKVCGRFIVGAV